MQTASVRQVRERLRDFLERARAGEEIVILRRGVEIARLVPPRRNAGAFPDLAEHRRTVAIGGEQPGEALRRMRDEAR